MTKKSEGGPAHPPLRPATRLVTSGRDASANHGFVNPPVHHASTVLYPTAEDFLARRARYLYGRRGTPTSEALENALRALEGPACAGVALLPSGLAAISTALLAVLNAGDHLLVTDSAYQPTRRFCDNVLQRYGIATTYYDPLIGCDIAALMQPNTRAVFVEAPGSLSFEIQDVPTIAAAAHARGALVVMDNTWATSLYFPAFDKGVDLSIQAATKYIGGHSDVMLGTVSANEAAWERLRGTVHTLGLCVGARRHLSRPARAAHHGRAAGAAPSGGTEGCTLARWAPRNRPRAPSGAGKLSRPCHLAARFFRRERTVQHRVQAGGAECGQRVRERAQPVRHRPVVGRIREPGHSIRLHQHPHGDEMGARRADGAPAHRT
jgi:Cys/Met metabolism PLP-dependent enzyme